MLVGVIRMDVDGVGGAAFVIFIDDFEGSGEESCTAGAAGMGVVNCEAGADGSPPS